MILNSVFKIALSAGVLFVLTVSNAAELSRAQRAACEIRLESKAKTRKTVTAKFTKGLDDDKATVGYIGVSQETMIQILKTGRCDTQVMNEEWGLHLTNEHPVPKPFIAAGPNPNDDWDRTTMTRMARRDASTNSRVSAVKASARRLGAAPTSNVEKYLYQLFAILDFASLEGKYPYYSASFLTLKEAIREVDMDLPEPIFVKTKFSEATELRMNMSEDYDRVYSLNKLTKLATALGLKDFDILKPESQAKLASMFSALPVQAGYVIGVNANLYTDRVSETPQISNCTLKDITGIEPVSDFEFEFMQELQKIR